MAETDPFQDNLPQLLARLWEDRRYLLLGAIMGLVFGCILSLVLMPQYEASMIVAPTAAESASQSFIDNTLPETRDTKGVFLNANNNFTRFEQSLRGTRVAGILIQMPDVTSKLREDGRFRFSREEIGSAEELALYLQDHVSINPVGSSASLKITYRHPDGVFATRLLTILRKADDQLIKTQDRDATIKRIEWLKESLKNSLNPEHRQALVRLLMTEERRSMLLSLDEPYTIQMIEEAATEPRKVVPYPVLYMFLSMVLGSLMGAVTVVIRDSMR